MIFGLKKGQGFELTAAHPYPVGRGSTTPPPIHPKGAFICKEREGQSKGVIQNSQVKKNWKGDIKLSTPSLQNCEKAREEWGAFLLPFKKAR